MSLLILLIALASSRMPQLSDVQGAWLCGPYDLAGFDMQISAVDHPVYSPDGTYSSLAAATYTLPDRTEIRVRTRHAGTWTLVGNLIEIKYTSAEFVSSDSPIITIATGQARLDAQMQRKDWAKKRVLSFGTELVTVPVESTDKRAQVQIHCTRA